MSSSALLPRIGSPADLRKLSEMELERLAGEIVEPIYAHRREEE